MNNGYKFQCVFRLYTFVRLKAERVEKENEKEGDSVLSLEWAKSREREKRNGNIREKKNRERDKGRRERGRAFRVLGKPMILKEGREDAH